MEKGWPAVEYCGIEYGGSGYYMGYTEITCTVKDVLSKTYGKMPDSLASRQIIMEYEYFMDTLANSTVFDPQCLDASTSEYFKSWILSVPGLSY